VTTPVTIRVDFPVDDVSLSRLHAIAFGNAPGELLPWANRLQQHSVSWVGAFHQDSLIGFVHACWDGGLHAFLLDTVVDPEYQRQGVGYNLVQTLIQRVRAAGASGSMSTTSPTWTRSTVTPAGSRRHRLGCSGCPADPSACGTAGVMSLLDLPPRARHPVVVVIKRGSVRRGPCGHHCQGAALPRVRGLLTPGAAQRRAACPTACT